MVLLFTDVVGSVDLKKRLGDAEAGMLIARHDALFRASIADLPAAEVLKDTGDGFMARFQSASDAVVAALRFQSAMRSEPWPAERMLRARVGIHLGEASELEPEDATGKPKISGLAVDLAARVMGLALPGQILLTGAAFDNARQNVREHPPIPGATTPPLRWMAHGPYLFHGSDEPMEVFEVGAVGGAPLVAPPDGEKARRAVAADEEETLGWRPAAGMSIPDRRGWVLERRLGEGGFGEVWLGVNPATGTRRVFKFCYDAERLRSLKRELTLFRLLRDALGDRDDIARLYDVQLDEPPFFLESEFTEEGSLVEWAGRIGGLDRAPLEQRIDIIARVADAVAAAHSVGVLHKDIKPGNILIDKDRQGNPRPRLTDFGIGMLTDRTPLDRRQFTAAGFTRTLLGQNQTHTGTPLYSPPEAFAGKPFTVQGDIYALGVMLYQMVVGDFQRPLGHGWERDVPDPILRSDIAACVAADGARRLASATELAERLRAIPQRRRAAKRKRTARLTGYASLVLLGLLGVAAVLFVRERDLREMAERELQRKERLLQYLVTGIIARSDPTRQRAGGPMGGHEAGMSVTIASALDAAFDAAERQLGDDPASLADVYRTLGLSYKNLDLYDKAERAMRRALEVRTDLYARDHPAIAESMLDVADTLWWQRRFEEALPLYQDALSMRRRLFPARSAPVAEALNNTAACLNSTGRRDEAEAFFRDALAIRSELHAADPASIDPMLIAAVKNNLANCLRQQNDDAKRVEAKRLFEEAIETARELGGEQHAYVARGLHLLAIFLWEIGEFDGAERRFLECLDIKRTLYEGPNTSVAATAFAFAEFLIQRNRTAEAEPHAHVALDIRRAAPDATPADLADSLTQLARLHEIAGRASEAEPLLIEAHEALASSPRYGPAHARTRQAIERLIQFYERAGRADDAARFRAKQG